MTDRPIGIADALRLLVVLRDGTAGKTDDGTAFANFCLNNVGQSHGQFLQDLWVAYELKSRRGGFFVEFGAADGRHCSNSLMLEERYDWTGILAEPARIYYPSLPRNRSCFIDRRCVWARSGEHRLFNEAEAPLHAGLADYAQPGKVPPRAQYQVETVSLADLLDHWQAPRRIDYLSVDTEGSEYDILSAFDFTSREIRLITVEHNHGPTREPIHALLTAQGYRRKFEPLSGVDDWYVREY